MQYKNQYLYFLRIATRKIPEMMIPEDSARQSSGALKGDNILWQTYYCFLIRFSLVKML